VSISRARSSRLIICERIIQIEVIADAPRLKNLNLTWPPSFASDGLFEGTHVLSGNYALRLDVNRRRRIPVWAEYRRPFAYPYICICTYAVWRWLAVTFLLFRFAPKFLYHQQVRPISGRAPELARSVSRNLRPTPKANGYQSDFAHVIRCRPWAFSGQPGVRSARDLRCVPMNCPCHFGKAGSGPVHELCVAKWSGLALPRD
jgi:hypothetical protein